jgi:hypothetical protein
MKIQAGQSVKTSINPPFVACVVNQAAERFREKDMEKYLRLCAFGADHDKHNWSSEQEERNYTAAAVLSS